MFAVLSKCIKNYVIFALFSSLKFVASLLLSSCPCPASFVYLNPLSTVLALSLSSRCSVLHHMYPPHPMLGDWHLAHPSSPACPIDGACPPLVFLSKQNEMISKNGSMEIKGNSSKKLLPSHAIPQVHEQKCICSSFSLGSGYPG